MYDLRGIIFVRSRYLVILKIRNGPRWVYFKLVVIISSANYRVFKEHIIPCIITYPVSVVHISVRTDNILVIESAG